MPLTERRLALLAVAEDPAAPATERMDAWRRTWTWLVLGGEYGRALTLSRQIRDLAEEAGDLAAAIRADVVAADVITLAPGPKAEALRLADDAVVEARGLRLPGVEARARVVYGGALASVGSVHAGIETMLDAKVLLRVQQDEAMLAWTDLRLAPLLLTAGQAAAATRMCDRVLAWARRHHDAALEAGASGALAHGLVALGQPREARAMAELGVLESRQLGAVVFEAASLVALGDCELLDGHPDKAVRRFEQSLALQEGHPEVLLRLGRALARCDRAAEAQEALRRGLAAALDMGDSEIEEGVRLELAALLEAEGDGAQAEQERALAAEAGERHRTTSYDARVAQMLAGFETERLQRENGAESDRRQ